MRYWQVVRPLDEERSMLMARDGFFFAAIWLDDWAVKKYGWRFVAAKAAEVDVALDYELRAENAWLN